VKAHAKINLALVVGPLREDGKHEVATVLQRIELADEVDIEPAASLRIDGYDDDTIVRGALRAIAEAAGTEPRWAARIEKRIPVAAGLGGGSSDAAAALLLANDLLETALSRDLLHELASTLGADVPFFLSPGPQLGTGDGSSLEPLDLPQDYTVLLVLPRGAAKESTAAVYGRFRGADGFGGRRRRLRVALEARDVAALPPNDLVSSGLSAELRRLGAFRAEVTGAGPAVYGLFHERVQAEAAAAAVAGRGRTWITAPAW